MSGKERISTEDYEETVKASPKKSNNLEECDSQLDRLDAFFQDITPGASIIIERIQPSWCSGVLEQVTVIGDEISIDYLIRKWGGQLLLVKLRGERGRIKNNYKIPLFTYPPKNGQGKILRIEDVGGYSIENNEPSSTEIAAPSPVVVNQETGMEKILQILPTLVPFISEWMKSQEARRNADMAMMVQMMKAQNGGGLSDITKVSAVMGQLQEMFRQKNGDALGGTDEMGFMTQALDVIKTVFDNKPKQTTTPTKTPRLAPPRGISNNASIPPAPPAKVTPITKPSSTNIAQTISNMEPDKAAKTIIEAMGQMPRETRDEAIGCFIAEYQADMGRIEESDDDTEDYEELDESRGRR